jgi:hypothetical protein
MEQHQFDTEEAARMVDDLLAPVREIDPRKVRQDEKLSALQAACQKLALTIYAVEFVFLALTGTLLSRHSIDSVRPIFTLPENLRTIAVLVGLGQFSLVMTTWSALQIMRAFLAASGPHRNRGIPWGKPPYDERLFYAAFLLAVGLWMGWQVISLA